MRRSRRKAGRGLHAWLRGGAEEDIADTSMLGLVREGDDLLIAIALRLGTNPNAADAGGLTGLMAATQTGNSPLVRALLRAVRTAGPRNS